MPYITYQQYTDLYGTPPIPETEFPVYAQAASDLIDSITQYRIVESGLSALPSLIQNLVEKAAVQCWDESSGVAKGEKAESCHHG